MPFPTARNAGTLIILGLIAAGGPARAQPPPLRGQPAAENPLVEVRYGSISISSFDKPNQLHRYALRVLHEGDRVKVTIKPTGETLRTVIGLFDPGEILVDSAPRIPGGGRDRSVVMVRRALRSYSGQSSPTISSTSLSARGLYSIEVYNGMTGGVGKYQLMIEAALPNGKTIKAGDKDPEGAEPTAAVEARKPVDDGGPAAPGARVVGFPGLPPADFSTAVTNDLPADGVIRGKIASDRDRIVRGYLYTPGASPTSEVTLRRTKGSGPLGFVILSAENEVLAQSSLMAADEVTTTIAFPAGAATLGVYRLDPRKAPEPGPTEYELRVKPVTAAGRR